MIQAPRYLTGGNQKVVLAEFSTFGPCFDLRPDLVEHLHEAVVDHERDGHVQTDPRHPGDGTLVESPRTLVDHNLAGAIHGISVANVIKLFTAVS